MSRTYPDRLEIRPLTKPPNATIRVPGSKSITNRALVLSTITAWTEGVELVGALQSEDTELMVAALQQFGFTVQPDWSADPPTIVVGPHEQHGDDYPPYPADVFVGNSGTTMRFLTAVATLGRGRFRLDGVPRMRQRPIKDLLDALHQVGVDSASENRDGCPPVLVEGQRVWKGDRLRIRTDVSSQFLSALLMVAPLACSANPFAFELDGPVVSKPYIDMTVKMVEAWGLPIWTESGTIKTQHAGAHGYQIPAMDHYVIEPDASAASYFLAAPAVAGGQVTVRELAATSLQGDTEFANALTSMGCRTEDRSRDFTVHGRPLRGIDIDMNAISDTVMTLAAVACFAEGPTTIRNVAHIRHKETDRIAAVATELRRLGAQVEELPDGLRITPRPMHGAEVETYNDHRMAMSLALIGLRVPGVVIKNPGCVAKTYPGFWEDFQKLYG